MRDITPLNFIWVLFTSGLYWIYPSGSDIGVDTPDIWKKTDRMLG